jgi:hypothetical protein
MTVADKVPTMAPSFFQKSMLNLLTAKALEIELTTILVRVDTRSPSGTSLTSCRGQATGRPGACFRHRPARL